MWFRNELSSLAEVSLYIHLQTRPQMAHSANGIQIFPMRFPNAVNVTQSMTMIRAARTFTRRLPQISQKLNGWSYQSLHLVLKRWMSGAIPPLPHMSSRFVQEQFCPYLTTYLQYMKHASIFIQGIPLCYRIERQQWIYLFQYNTTKFYLPYWLPVKSLVVHNQAWRLTND